MRKYCIHERISLKRALMMLSLVVFVFISTYGQGDYQAFYRESLKKNNAGMIVLGSWAVLNISTGAYGWSRYNGETKYFHQMNFFWNTVNLTIAGLALYGNHQTDVGLLSDQEILQKHITVERLFLINGLLDIGYMGTGFLLKHLSGKYPKNGARLTGYGNSVILQGAFLFLFDGLMWGLQRSHRMEFLENLQLQASNDLYGISMMMQF